MKWIISSLLFLFSTQLVAQNIIDSKIERLPNNINTEEDELQIVTFGEDIVYYTSTIESHAKLFRTEKLDKTWKDRLKPAVLNLENPYYGGSFTPNKQRFYFAVFENGSYTIYCMKREGVKWIKPVKLSSPVNLIGQDAFDPFVVVEGNQEILYFSSNRSGGLGGTDIWYATKDYSSDELNFSTPVNLGEQINTIKDEAAPHLFNDELFFSSNGHLDNIGKFDIYRAKGSKNSWEEAKLLPEPFNSKADDMHFALKENGTEGFLSSNRVDIEREVTRTDFDIYQLQIDLDKAYHSEEKNIASGNIIEIRGIIHEQADEKHLINNGFYKLYIVRAGREQAMVKQPIGGEFEIELLRNNQYRLELSHPDYETTSHLIDTRGLEKDKRLLFMDFHMSSKNR